MSDVEELLNQGLLSEENGGSAETRSLLISENFSEVVNYQEDTLIVTQGGVSLMLFTSQFLVCFMQLATQMSKLLRGS
ncbi:MAG: hypothetical protein VYC09_07940 [Verrucomicrobiota bacterium]|nr:hypothetical protein [Verrucomicrobiota bacterium]